MVMHSRIFTAMVIPSRACARPRQRPGTLLTRPAYGSHKSSANPVHSNALRLRNISADLRVQPAYSKRLGGMGGVNDDGVAAMSATTGGAARMCIGPEGPIVVRPEGRTDSRAIGLTASRPEGRLDCVPMTAGLRAVHCVYYLYSKYCSQQTGTAIEHRIWPVTDSYLRIQTAWLSKRARLYVGQRQRGHLHQRRTTRIAD